MFSRFRYHIAVAAALLAIALFATTAITPKTADAEDPYNNNFPFGGCNYAYGYNYGCYNSGYTGCYGYGYDCGYCYSYGCGNCYGGGYYGHDPYYHDDDDDEDEYDHGHCHPYNFNDLDGYPGFLKIVASPGTINCGSTTTITVDIFLPDDYYGGVTVALSHNVPGTVKPGPMQQTYNGRAVFTYTAPADWNGPVRIAASTEYEENSLTIQVNCKTGNPSPPPIKPLVPVATTGGIQPPNTGEAGLLGSDDDGAGWPLIAAGASIGMVGSGLFLARRRYSK